MGNKLYFATTRPNTIIPSKLTENAGYDIYANFSESFVVIRELETKLISTGLLTAFSRDYVMVLKERGSTGTKGMAQRCGVIDSGYRGEIFVPITNCSDRAVIISKLSEEETAEASHFKTFTYYPYSKAICQAVMLRAPVLHVEEVSLIQLKAMSSKRGDGKLGSSGK